MNLLRQRMIEANAICTIAVEPDTTARHSCVTKHGTETAILLTTGSKEIWVW
jgi:hypothetical protein